MAENLRSARQTGVIESRVMRMFVELCTQHRETPSVVPDVLDGWVLRSGDEWRFDASRAMEGGARTRAQYELFRSGGMGSCGARPLVRKARVESLVWC